MATTFRNKKNHPLGVGTLNTAIDDNDLTIVLDAGQGASFPAATFTISIDEEIILIDSRSTDTLTVNASGRGYDSSTASAHAAGVAITNNQIVKDFTDLETLLNTIENKLDGTNPVAADDVYLKYGTDGDIKFGYDETTNDRGEWRDPSNNVLAYIKDLGTTGMFGVTGRIECPQIGISADTDLLGLAANALTVNGTVTASADADSTHTFGRGRLHSSVSDWTLYSHFDNANSTNYAIGQAAAGQTRVNGATGQGLLLCVANAAKVTFDGSTATFADAINMVFNTTTGTKIGTGTTQKIGFWNATPIVQPASANQAALTNSTAGTYDGTLAALADLTDSPASADALRDDIVTNLLPVLRNNFTDIFTLIDAMRTAMVNSGLMKGAA